MFPWHQKKHVGISITQLVLGVLKERAESILPNHTVLCGLEVKTRKPGENIPYKVKANICLQGLGEGTLLEIKSNDFGLLKMLSCYIADY